MNHRKGATLVEVLAAIFIMGVGLMALLTLFPLGALSMAEGIRNDRAAHIAPNAAAIAKFRGGGPNGVGIRNDHDPNNPNNTAWQGYTNPDPSNNVIPANQQPPPAGSPSYPVFIDPYGWLANGCASNPALTNPGRWVGSTQIPRRTVSFASTLSNIAPWFSLLDDMTFQENGQPATPMDRTGKYAWAYLCKQVVAGSNYGTNLSVVLYDNRPQMSNSITQTIGEHTYTQATVGTTPVYTGSFNSNVVSLIWNAGQDPPPVKKGTWILDASTPTYLHGFFYRIVGVSQTSNNSMDVELQTNVRATTPMFGGTVVVMDNVIEVFERGQN
jgi:hypothetical protein